MIEVSHISKTYNGKKVLEDVSLSVGKCETMCIIGSMGSGKSTLLRCIAGLEFPESGKISIDGRLIERTSQSGYNHIGMVFQNFNLFPHFTVLRNITEAQIHVLGRNKVQAQQRGRELLAKMGLSDKENSYPCELSGGQQQRVSIARALALDPQVLFFDEPTSALDPELTGEILKVIRELAQEHMTMVVVTHEMAFARDLSDRIIFMDGGVIVEQGSAQDVINNPQQERTKAFLSRFQS